MAKTTISTFRRVLNWIGLAVVLTLLGISLIGFLAWRAESKYAQSAAPYLEETLPTIVQWDAATIWALYSPEVREFISREDHNNIVHSLARLGGLESLGRPRFLRVATSATARTGSMTIVSYEVPAKFENGEATIFVNLKDEDGEFSIYGFNVNSMALLQ